MELDKLASVAQAMVADNKGLLAADESTGTITKRFASINVESTEENRRHYRELRFRASGLGEFISGVILFDETIRQSSDDGTRLVDLLESQGIIPGIKVDAGAKPLAGSNNETITEGLDGLSDRVAEYVDLGAKFAKWRAVIKINGNNTDDLAPTDHAIHTNAHALARYAKICQEGGLVPIVEPEILMDGDHDIAECQFVTEETLHSVFNELHAQNVCLEGVILKPNMVISGMEAKDQASPEQVAEQTVMTLLRHVPAAIPGIMFLSGGQREVDASVHLNLMNSKYENLPWELSYSYGRALQASALKAWSGKTENTALAQEALLSRASLNSAACAGIYTGEAA